MTDRLDVLLQQRCSILSNDGPLDGYGQQSTDPSTWVVVASSVPCLVDTVRLGSEETTEPKVPVHERRIFMKEPTLSNGQSLNPHHYILCEGVYYNVIDPERYTVAIPHLEVLCREIGTLFAGETGS